MRRQPEVTASQGAACGPGLEGVVGCSSCPVMGEISSVPVPPAQSSSLSVPGLLFASSR